MRVTTKEAIAAEWTRVREAQSVAVPARGPMSGALPAASAATDAVARGGWLRAGARFIRSAAIGTALLLLVPIAVVSTGGDALWSENWGTRERLAAAERSRPLMAPRDAAITPMEAGLAFRALQPTRTDPLSQRIRAENAAFPMRVVASSGERVWQQRELTPSMFPGLIGPGYRGPKASLIIERAQRPFSTEELAYLRAVAESPVWRDFDRIASAAQVDLLGGQYVLPFREDASAITMPMMRFAGTKELASAGVSRAAYYAAIGQPERAEASLRSVVSFGFAMMDNGTTLVDALIGQLIVGIGRDGLHQWYEITHDAGGVALTARSPRSRLSGPRRRAERDVDAVRARLLADATDPRVPRTLRFESLQQLSFATCSNTRDMLLGPPAEVNAAFAAAGSTLARYPSERAYLELVGDAINRVPDEMTPRGPLDRLMVGAATVAGVVLNNPRMETCTRIVLMQR